MKNILAADIGGTNSRFARFRVNQERLLTLEEEEWIDTRSVNSFQELIKKASKKINIEENNDILIFGVPGPVERGYYANLVNVPWQEIDISAMRERLKQRNSKVYMINDFVSQAFGCLNKNLVNDVNTIEIKSGLIDDYKTGLSVIGAGTGLGHCTLIVNEDGTHTPVPSEAGQIAFPFQTEEEISYKNFLREEIKVELIRNDDVVSGPGLARLHHYLTGRQMSPIEVGKEINPDSETTQWFARFFARSCRNYALSILGVCSVLYITGGVAASIPFLVDNDVFRDEFIHSSKQDDLNKILIKLIRHKSLGLWGSAQYGLEHLF